jgi:hypothetical protein
VCVATLVFRPQRLKIQVEKSTGAFWCRSLLRERIWWIIEIKSDRRNVLLKLLSLATIRARQIAVALANSGERMTLIPFLLDKPKRTCHHHRAPLLPNPSDFLAWKLPHWHSHIPSL